MRLPSDNVRFGSKADILHRSADVRFTPKSRHWNSVAECPLCAKSGHMQCSKFGAYSITSSAATCRVCGTVRPSALAVLRLITKSNLIGCSTGRSAGRVPCKILST